MKLTILSLLFTMAAAKLATPEDRQLRMMMKKKNGGNGGKSGKGKGKSQAPVNLVDTDAEVLALIYMERACFANPFLYNLQCTANGGYGVVLDNSSGTLAEFCCPADAFDPTYVMMNPSTTIPIITRRLNEDVSEEELAEPEARRLDKALVPIVIEKRLIVPCVPGTVSSPSITIIIGTTAYCANTNVNTGCPAGVTRC